jgi:hypothetical protein
MAHTGSNIYSLVHFAAPNLFSGVFYVITEPIPPPNLFSGVAPTNLFSDTFFLFKNLTGDQAIIRCIHIPPKQSNSIQIKI